MIRNRKALGLALATLFAFGAMSASAASAAVGTLTSDGPFSLYITENAGTVNGLTAFAGRTECPGSVLTGYKQNTILHELISNDSSTATLTPDLVNCRVIEGTTNHKATVTMNECDYVLHLGETILTSSIYSTTIDVVCPASRSIVIDVYNNETNENFPGKVCEITVGPQTGLTGATAQNVANEMIAIEGAYTRVRASKSGLCGSATTETGELDIHVTALASNSIGGTTGVAISHL